MSHSSQLEIAIDVDLKHHGPSGQGSSEYVLTGLRHLLPANVAFPSGNPILYWLPRTSQRRHARPEAVVLIDPAYSEPILVIRQSKQEHGKPF